MLSVDAVALFLDDRRARNCRPRTIEFYDTHLARLAARHRAVPTTPAPLRAILAAVGGAPSSRHGMYRVLRAFYRWLAAEGEIPANPMELVAAPRVPKVVQRTLDRSDVDELLASELSARDRAILTLILDSGLRSGEVRSLRGRDLHDGWILVTGKSGERPVPAHADTLALLRGLARGADDAIFRTVDGRPLCRNRLYAIVSAALRRAGIDKGGKKGPHLLRHTFGRGWVAAEGGLPELQKILGHAQITTTMIYAELSTDEVQKAHAAHSRLTRPGAERLRRVK